MKHTIKRWTIWKSDCIYSVTFGSLVFSSEEINGKHREQGFTKEN